MQYAIKHVGLEGLPWLLMDAAELFMLDDRKQPEEITEGASTFKLAYGAMMWAPPTDDRGDPTESEREKAEAGIKRCLGIGFRHLIGPAKAANSILSDIRFYPDSSKRRHVPFAALIQTDHDIPSAESFGWTMFPHYRDMDYLTNILNRPALLCVKGEDVRARGAVGTAPSEWEAFIKPGRPAIIAAKCR